MLQMTLTRIPTQAELDEYSMDFEGFLESFQTAAAKDGLGGFTIRVDKTPGGDFTFDGYSFGQESWFTVKG